MGPTTYTKPMTVGEATQALNAARRDGDELALQRTAIRFAMALLLEGHGEPRPNELWPRVTYEDAIAALDRWAATTDEIEAGDARRAADVRESLQHFGTVTFARSYARQFITWDPIAGRIDATRWSALVPEVYRADVEPIVAQVFDAFRYRKFYPDSLDEFTTRLFEAIWERVEPRR